MPRKKEATLQETIISTIGGDRRREQRYETDLPLRYMVAQSGLISKGGIGTSIDLSSSGIKFFAGEVLQTGVSVEITLDWPCAGDRKMELVISGRVVRSDSHSTSLGYTRREFRQVDQPMQMYAVAAS